MPRSGEPIARSRRALGLWILLVGTLLALLAPRQASAGTVTCTTPAPKEEDGRWTLSFNFDYGRVPDMPHIAMMFSFQHVTQYEWSLTDESPNRPVFTRKPLHNQPEINVSTDVGFADLSGKVWRVTKNYKIELRRDAGFESGEYTLTIREGGRIFGRPIRLTLKGENKPVDRRAINIEAPKPPPKAESKNGKGADGDKSDLPPEDSLEALEQELGSQDLSGEDPDGPPPEKPRQGGCGCALPGQGRSPAWLGVLGAMGLGLVRRTRRRLR